MVPKRLSTAKKAPTLKDSRFHSNNTVQSIKALERYQEKGIITEDDAHLIDEYLVKRKADKDLSQGRVTKILWTLLSWRRFVPPFR
jgi:integrase/recombinase XerD